MTQENAQTALNNVQQTRDRLQQLMLDAVAWSQRLDLKREQHKVTEDALLSEIWNNPAYKNDKQRNEQKHLAKINDERFTIMRDEIHDLELKKAQCHADILWTQNALAIATIQYQYSMVGTAPGVQLDIFAVEKEKADTTTEIVPEIKQHHPVVADEPVAQSGSLRDTLKQAIPAERQAELASDDTGELSDADKIRLIEGYVACKQCGKAIYTPTDEHVTTVDGKKFCSEKHKENYEQDNAPYFSTNPAAHTKEYKDKKEKEDGDREKFGGIRI